jgi:hypothetical protein
LTARPWVNDSRDAPRLLALGFARGPFVAQLRSDRLDRAALGQAVEVGRVLGLVGWAAASARAAGRGSVVAVRFACAPFPPPAVAANWRRVDDLVRVALVDTEPEAELAVSQLGLEGIPAMWKQTNLGASWILGAGSGGGIMGPLAILVDSENAERARELLEAEDFKLER